jgi:hypothetical protein
VEPVWSWDNHPAPEDQKRLPIESEQKSQDKILEECEA